MRFLAVLTLGVAAIAVGAVLPSAVEAQTVAGRVTDPSQARSRANEIIAQVRSQAAELNEYRAALADADPAVRLAIFNTLIQHENETFRRIAMEAALSSTDRVVREQAFKHLFFGLTQLHVRLQPDPSSTPEVQKVAAQFLSQGNVTYAFLLEDMDPKAGTFKASNWAGQLSGQQVTLRFDRNNYGSLLLQQDNTLQGVLHTKDGVFLGSARLF